MNVGRTQKILCTIMGLGAFCAVSATAVAAEEAAASGGAPSAAVEVDPKATTDGGPVETAGATANVLQTYGIAPGARVGMIFATGPWARELNGGYELALFVGGGVPGLSWLRAELALGFTRQGRTVEAKSNGIIRFPLVLSVEGTLPIGRWLPVAAVRELALLGRVGIGVAPTTLARGGKTSLREGALDALGQLALGLNYPLGRPEDDGRWGLALLGAYSWQFADRTVGFAGFGLGVTRQF